MSNLGFFFKTNYSLNSQENVMTMSIFVRFAVQIFPVPCNIYQLILPVIYEGLFWVSELTSINVILDLGETAFSF